MDKIDIASFRDALKEAALAGERKVIPADLRDFASVSIRNAFDPAGEECQPFDAGALFALLKDKLKAQTDSQKGFSGFYSLPDRPLKIGGAQTLHCIPEGTDTGKDDVVRGEDLTCVRCHLNLVSQETDSIFHTFDISCIVINNRNHISFPQSLNSFLSTKIFSSVLKSFPQILHQGLLRQVQTRKQRRFRSFRRRKRGGEGS